MSDREYRIGNLIFLDHNHDGRFSSRNSGDSIQVEDSTSHQRTTINTTDSRVGSLVEHLGLYPRQLEQISLENLQNYADALYAFENGARQGQNWQTVMLHHSTRLFAQDYFCHIPEDAGYDVDCTIQASVAARLDQHPISRNYSNVSDFVSAAREALTRAQQAHNGNLPSGDDIQNVFDVLEAVENEMRSPNFPAAWRQNSAVVALAQEIASYSSRSEGNAYLAAVTRTEQHLNQNLIAHLGEVWDDLRDLNVPFDDFTNRPLFNLDPALTAQVNTLRQRLYAKGLELAQAEKQRLQAEQARLERERGAEIQRAQANISRNRAELAEHQRELATAQTQLPRLRAQLAAAEANIARLPGEISRLQREIDAAPFYRPDIYLPLRSQKSTAEQQLDNARLAQERLRGEIQSTEHTLRHHERMIPTTMALISNYERDLQTFQQNRDFGTNEIRTVRDQIGNLDRMIALWTRARQPNAAH